MGHPLNSSFFSLQIPEPYIDKINDSAPVNIIFCYSYSQYDSSVNAFIYFLVQSI